MKRKLVIDDTEDWPPAPKRLRVDLSVMGVVQVRPCDDVPLGLVADMWTGQIVSVLIADGYACRTLVMLRRTCRWLAHHVTAAAVPVCSDQKQHVCAWISAYEAECRAFLAGGHTLALGWQITTSWPCNRNWDKVHRDIAHACLVQGNIEAFERVCRAATVMTTRDTMRLAINLGNASVVHTCLKRVQGYDFARFLAQALAAEKWSILSILVKAIGETDWHSCLHSLPASFITHLAHAAARSPVALAAAFDMQNHLLRFAKLGGSRYKEIRGPLLDLARLINRHAVTQ